MEQKFKVGDKVKWLGVTGIIKNILEDYDVPIEVRWDNDRITHFYADGRYFLTGEPCLELLERPKKKVKRTFYRANYQDNIEEIIYTSKWFIDKSFITRNYSVDKGYKIINIEEREFEIELD